MSSTLTLASPAFKHEGAIPGKYTCDARESREVWAHDISPSLVISGVPEGTKSLALTMDDPDIPREVKEARGIDVFVHWVLYNIAPDVMEITEGASAEESIGIAGLNGTGNVGYTGPCPPPQYEPSEHRYVFTLYALSRKLHFNTPPKKQEVLDALAPMVLAKAELIGRYARK